MNAGVNIVMQYECFTKNKIRNDWVDQQTFQVFETRKVFDCIPQPMLNKTLAKC
jgi:hypothetical protein